MYEKSEHVRFLTSLTALLITLLEKICVKLKGTYFFFASQSHLLKRNVNVVQEIRKP